MLEGLETEAREAKKGLWVDSFFKSYTEHPCVASVVTACEVSHPRNA